MQLALRQKKVFIYFCNRNKIYALGFSKLAPLFSTTLSTSNAIIDSKNIYYKFIYPYFKTLPTIPLK